MSTDTKTDVVASTSKGLEKLFDNPYRLKPDYQIIKTFLSAGKHTNARKDAAEELETRRYNLVNVIESYEELIHKLVIEEHKV